MFVILHLTTFWVTKHSGSKNMVYVCLPLHVVCLCVCLDILGKLESIDIKY